MVHAMAMEYQKQGSSIMNVSNPQMIADRGGVEAASGAKLSFPISELKATFSPVENAMNAGRIGMSPVIM